MKPLTGLVCDVVDGELVVELENGDIARFHKRDGLRYGDRVFVGYDYKNMKVGHILPREHVAYREIIEPDVELERPDEDPHDRMNSDQFEEALRSLSQGNEEFEELEVDDFEVLRSLEQGSEDIESLDGE